MPPIRCRSAARRATTAVAAAVAGGVLTGALAGPAAAHVTVTPSSAASGTSPKLTFRVMNESDTAATVQLTVTFPTETPIAVVSLKPHPTWTARVTHTPLLEPVVADGVTMTETVSSVTWAAGPGPRLERGQFEEFEVLVGPLPEGQALAFPADQLYNDGRVVSWSEEATEGEEPPALPAPVLELTPAASPDGDGTAAPSARTVPSHEAHDVEAAAALGASEPDPVADGTARALGLAGLVTGAIGLVAASFLVARARRAEDR